MANWKKVITDADVGVSGGVADYSHSHSGYLSTSGGKVSPYLKIGNYTITKTLAVAFANGVANQKYDIYFEKFWGELEISITGTYSHQNMAGVVTKRFGVGLQTGSFYANDSRFVEVLGVTGNNFTISDITWDSNLSKYKIQIVHRTSTGNTVAIKVTAFANSETLINYIKNLTTSSVYTTDTTVFSAPSVSFISTNVGIGTTSPLSPIEVSKGGRSIGGTLYSVIDAGGTGTTGGLYLGYNTRENYAGAIASQSNSLSFWTHDGSNWGEKLTIADDGNVGIGTTSPDNIFHVAKSNSGGVGGQITIDNFASSALGNTAELSFLTDSGASGTGTRNARILAVNENQSNGAANLQFHTWSGGTSAERLRIDSSGNVGIGTTNPAYKLDVNGTFRATGNATFEGQLNASNNAVKGVGYLEIYDNGGSVPSATSPRLYSPSTGALGISCNNVERMRFDASGRVGIGRTPTAGSKLDVEGAIYAKGKPILDSDGTAHYVKSNSHLYFYSGSSLNMILNSSGKVGIGTTSPYSKLWVHSPTTNSIVYNDSTTTAGLVVAGSDANVRLQMGTGNNTLGPYGGWIQASYDNGASEGVEPLLLNPNGGNVGIGTTSPDEKLEIDGGASYPNLKISSTNNTSRFMKIGMVDAAEHTIEANGSGAFLTFNTAGSNERMRIDSSGNVGIGTTNPDEELHIDGIVKVSEGTNDYLTIQPYTDGNTYFNAYGAGAGEGGFVFRTNDGSTSSLFIQNNSNVGVGTASPDKKLHVSGGDILLDNDYDLWWENSVGTAVDVMKLDSSNNVIINNGNSANGDIDLQTGSVSKLYIDGSAGNVGIGTTSPSYKLDVNGTFRATGGTLTGALTHNRLHIAGNTALSGIDGMELGADSSEGCIVAYDRLNSHYKSFRINALDLNVQTSGFDSFAIDTDGKVGIGTASPDHTLHLDSSTADEPILFIRNSNAGSGCGRLYFEHDSSSPADNDEIGQIRFYGNNDAGTPESLIFSRIMARATDITDGTEDGEIEFFTYDDGTETSTMMMKSGNVGIGTTSPDYQFEIENGSSDLVYMNMKYNDAHPNRIQMGLENYDGYLSMWDGADSKKVHISADGTTDTYFNAGNVGIGTASPSVKLHTYASSGDNELRIEANGAGNDTILNLKNTNTAGGAEAHIRFYDSTTPAGGISYAHNSGGVNDYMYFRTNATTQMTIDNSGNVGIGTTSPAKDLDVSGEIRASTGILFGTDTTSANTLNDYEEGSWTPTLNVSGTHSGSVINNRYTKIGNMVTLWGHLSDIQESGSQTADFTITGLPFTVLNNATGGTAMLNSVSFGSKVANVSCFVNTSENLFFYESNSAGAWTKLTWADFSDDDDVYFQLTYQTVE